MTRNTIGGKGHKRAKRWVPKEEGHTPIKIDNETDYAVVNMMLGNGRMQVTCLGDKQTRLAIVRGSMYKKVWIAKEDIVLVSLRDFQEDKCDVIHKYSAEEVKKLKNDGAIPVNVHNTDDVEGQDDIVFDHMDDTFIHSI